MDANKQICAVLDEEANVLATWLHDQEDELEKWPHRVGIAIRSEINRLRALASELEKKGAGS